MPERSPETPGKLESLGAKSRTYEGDSKRAQNQLITISPVSSPAGGYRLKVAVNGALIPFLLDTGAAVSLLREDTWNQVNTSGITLQVSEKQLVGVDGSPLQVLGEARVDLNLAGTDYPIAITVVSSLTSPAILGLDFLQENAASVDLEKKELHLTSRNISLPLYKSGDPADCPVDVVRVVTSGVLRVPPRSEMEVMASASNRIGEGVWLLEQNPAKRLPITVAAAVVRGNTQEVPVRLVNTRSVPAVVQPGTAVAQVHPLGANDCFDTVAATVVEEDSAGKDDALWQLVEESGGNLSGGEQQQFHQLLLTYSDIFATSDVELGRTNKMQHHIFTGDAAPVRQAVRRLTPQRREEVRRLLDEMLAQDVISPSSSPWASPIVLVKKKDGRTRFCVDYRKLNHLTRKDAYPLPRIDDTLNTLAGSKWFSTLDLISGYWQVELDQQTREKTAFCTPEGLFEFNVMPFGRCNAPATFQRLMDLVLAGLQWSQCLVYLDDVIVMGRTFSEHLQNLSSVFSRIREAGLKLKPAKCAFLQPEVHYLGHIVSGDGVATDPSKVEKVKTWPAPTSTKETQSFLGFASYYRRFIRNFAQIAKPLHKLAERNVAFRWTEECQAAFDELRQKLCSAPVLAYPDFKKSFILDTDASDTGIGGVLSQLDDDGRERVIAYGSRLLSKAERRYCVTRRELLAMVVFTRQFKPYLLGRRFVLRTDHGSLTWLRNFKEPEGQFARWLEELQQFDFEIAHRRGRKHTNADALSRLPCRQCGRDTHVDIPTVALTSLVSADTIQHSLQDLHQAQLEDATIGPILKAKQEGQKPQTDEVKRLSRDSRRLLQLWDQLVTGEDGVLYRLYEDAVAGVITKQLIIPTALRKEVLAEIHEGQLGGHLGEEKTLAKLKERFYWPGHYNDVRDWCRTCAPCAARKTPAPRGRAALHSIQAGYPMQMVAVDILGPFPESDSGNSYILVVSDYFTRWTEAYAIPNQEAATVAKKLTDEFFFHYSPPEQLHSDQGKQFESQLLSEVCKLLGITKSRTTAYHPQSDGLVERYNRTLLAMLSTAATERPFDWEDHLRRLCMAFNTSVQSTTGHTPFYLMFGRQARMPIDIMYGNPAVPESSPSEYAQHLRDTLESAYQHVRVHTGHKLERQKELYDRRVHGSPFEEGDLVWLHSPVPKRGLPRKLHQPWTGPFRVVRRLSDANYRIQNVMAPRQRLVVHFDRLKRCPKDIRISLRRPAKDSHQLSPSVPEAPTPPGTNLTYVEPEDPPPPPQPRYPQRNRQPPTYYQPIVVH